ncbi:hypothetical protein Pcinc_015231 [Petrolisthes cinctipes]|uniref:WAP domain-containing protein n=1 Tax=Petrolisthes cinctipes TaxID=88211 RepID=A0AAE1KND0_PETCI|nr:hypothetical protein Pcinc_015231 [Petrolisthes cinctipes]
MNKVTLSVLLVVLMAASTTASSSYHPHGRCPFIDVAVTYFPPGQPIWCYNDRQCPRGQICCPAKNAKSNLCAYPERYG